MKKSSRPLTLTRETIQALTSPELHAAKGGAVQLDDTCGDTLATVGITYRCTAYNCASLISCVPTRC
ncbi:MAG: hypothetical protein WKG01_30205 [Kofleriaceae bacterium]